MSITDNSSHECSLSRKQTNLLDAYKTHGPMKHPFRSSHIHSSATTETSPQYTFILNRWTFAIHDVQRASPLHVHHHKSQLMLPSTHRFHDRFLHRTLFSPQLMFSPHQMSSSDTPYTTNRHIDPNPRPCTTILLSFGEIH
jgi:hypothetical protein